MIWCNAGVVLLYTAALRTLRCAQIILVAMGRRRERPRQSQPLGLRLVVVGLTGLGTLSQGLVGMTNRRWQWFWLIASAVILALLAWLATSDPGVLSKKF